MPGMELVHFAQVGIEQRYDHEHGIVFRYDGFMLFGQQCPHIVKSQADPVRQCRGNGTRILCFFLFRHVPPYAIPACSTTAIRLCQYRFRRDRTAMDELESIPALKLIRLAKSSSKSLPIVALLPCGSVMIA